MFIHPWPLELVNGRPLDPQVTLRHVQELREQVAPDLFADFNGVPKGNAKTEFYQHDANWSNRMILGDSLQVMASLAEREGLRGQVQCIYIDPPYNTGGEFIYPDNYKEGLSDYLKFSGQVSGEGIKLTTNAETDGRYHSRWLTMMYPRLFLARNLLRENGVIFVSIDDHEVHNLRAAMNEIFGEENFVATFVWKRRASSALPDRTEF